MNRHQNTNLVLAAGFLAARAAEFVVVGGCALLLHGWDHEPADLDVVPAPSPANLQRLFDALDELGTVGPIWRPTAHALGTRDIVTRVTPIGKVDVLLGGGRTEHTALAAAATSMRVGRRSVRVAPIDDVLRRRVRFGTVRVYA